MPASFIGQTTLGGTVEGLNDAFVDVGEALVALRDELLVHLPCLAEAVDLLAQAKAAIRIPAVADFEAQLTGAVAMGLQLQGYLLDPIGYVQGLLSGVANLNVSIPAMLPQVALTTQIAANAAVAASLTAKIAAVDTQLAALLSISALLAACSVALAAVAAAAMSAVTTYQRFKAYLETAGAYAFVYTGAFSDTWSALSTVAASSGISSSDSVQVTVQVVRSASAAAAAAHTAIFTTS